MTAKEAVKKFKADDVLLSDRKGSEAVIERNNLAIIALEMAEWVASEIFDEDFDFDFFAEIVCRKLHSMGIIGKSGRNWTYEVKEIREINFVDADKLIKKLDNRIDEFIKKHPVKKNGVEVESIRELIHVIELEATVGNMEVKDD